MEEKNEKSKLLDNNKKEGNYKAESKGNAKETFISRKKKRRGKEYNIKKYSCEVCSPKKEFMINLL